MPRALTVQRTLIPPQERKRYGERLVRRQEYYAKAGCRFWAFEEAGLPGAFLEFFEAPDVETLTRAHQSAPDPILDSGRVYIEVELP
ncbi:MAG: hypothetical protein KGL93_03940 [Gemmatimonadota bacterium]|nr:hypothetical protein [Gemmatimonadota bacterium]